MNIEEVLVIVVRVGIFITGYIEINFQTASRFFVIIAIWLRGFMVGVLTLC